MRRSSQFLTQFHLRRWLFALPLVAAAFLVMGDLTIAPSAPVLANNAALQLLPLKGGNGIYAIRRGFITAGDGGDALYQGSSSACSLNSGNGDNGSQVKAADGGCWLLVAPAIGADFRIWGVVFDGSTDNSTALQNAFNWGAAGNTLVCPSMAQPAIFATGVSATLGSAVSATFKGNGPDQCLLKFNGSDGAFALTVNYGSPANPFTINSTHFAGFSLLAGGVGVGKGIAFAVS